MHAAEVVTHAGERCGQGANHRYVKSMWVNHPAALGTVNVLGGSALLGGRESEQPQFGHQGKKHLNRDGGVVGHKSSIKGG